MAKILIIDDSATGVKQLSQILNKNGYDVLSCESAEEGIDTLEREQPDVVLMDVVMPGMNGFQATREIVGNPETSHIPVIIVSVKDQETDKVWGRRQGARAYLTKPVDEQQLLTTITQVAAH
jgi:twitching motility two-component system response regulator PilH